MDKVFSNLKLLVKGLIVVAIVLVLMGLCGKFLGGYGLIIGIGAAAAVVAYLIHRFEDKINEKPEDVEGSG